MVQALPLTLTVIFLILAAAGISDNRRQELIGEVGVEELERDHKLLASRDWDRDWDQLVFIFVAKLVEAAIGEDWATEGIFDWSWVWEVASFIDDDLIFE